MFELSVTPKLSKDRENVLLLKRCIELGWTHVAWNTSCIGKVNPNLHRPMKPIKLEQSEAKEAHEVRSVLSSSSTITEISQLSRITLTIDDIFDAQTLHAGNNNLNAFDIIAARPGNAKVLDFLCRTAEIDIISIDFSVKTHFLSINKKMLDEAAKRGIFFEICYSSMLTSSNARKEIVANTKVVMKYLRGQHLIISSGADSYNQLRGPLDVINIGRALQLTREQAAKAVGENCLALLQHAKARKLKYIPVEVISASTANERYPWLGTKLSNAQRAWRVVLETSEDGAPTLNARAIGSDYIPKNDKRSDDDESNVTPLEDNEAMNESFISFTSKRSLDLPADESNDNSSAPALTDSHSKKPWVDHIVNKKPRLKQ